MTPGGSSGPNRAAAPSAIAGRPPFILILAITVTGIMSNVMITPVLPDIGADLHISKGEVGMLLAAATAPGILLAPVMGALADRFGRREVVVPCLVLFGLAGGSASFAPSFAVLVALRLLQGVGSAGLINLAVVLITDHWSGLDRARMIGRNTAALTASIVVLPPLGGLLSTVGGWRATFLPYWLGLVTGAVLFVRLPRSTGREGTIRRQLQISGRAVRSRAVLGPVSLGFAVFVLIFGLVLTAAPIYLDEAFGLGSGARGLVLALPAVTSTAAALSLGRLRSHVEVRLLVLGGLILFAAGFAMVSLLPFLAAVCAGALAFGLGDGLLIATLQDTVAEQAPPESRGAVVATWLSFARAGQTAGPLLAGAGMDTVGFRATFGLGAAAAAALGVVHRPLLSGATPRSTDEVLARASPD
jgi:ACDE family multidrug resistance protein